MGSDTPEDASGPSNQFADPQISISDGSGPKAAGGLTFSSGNTNQYVRSGADLKVSGTIEAGGLKITNQSDDEELVVGCCLDCGAEVDIWARQLVVVLINGKRRIRPDPPCCNGCLDNRTLARLRDSIRDRTGYQIHQDGELTVRVYDEDADPDAVREALEESWAELVTAHALIDDPATT